MTMLCFRHWLDQVSLTVGLRIVRVGPPHRLLVNTIEMVQIRAARICRNEYKTMERGRLSEIVEQLHLEPLNIRCTNGRPTIIHKAINGHLTLPIGHLQFRQFCVRPGISVAYHSPIIRYYSFQQRLLQIFIVSKENKLFEFTTRQNNHHQRSRNSNWHSSTTTGALVLTV